MSLEPARARATYDLGVHRPTSLPANGAQRELPVLTAHASPNAGQMPQFDLASSLTRKEYAPPPAACARTPDRQEEPEDVALEAIRALPGNLPPSSTCMATSSRHRMLVD